MTDAAEQIKNKLAELQNGLSSLTDKVEQVETAPQLELPKEAELDKYESLFVDSIMWREDAALSKMKLAKSESEMCRLMRQNLVGIVSSRLGVDTTTHSISINQDTKKVIIAKRQ